MALKPYLSAVSLLGSTIASIATSSANAKLPTFSTPKSKQQTHFQNKPKSYRIAINQNQQNPVGFAVTRTKSRLQRRTYSKNSEIALNPNKLPKRVRSFFYSYYRHICQINPQLTKSQARTITYYLLKYADRYNVEPRLIVAIITQESRFRPEAHSPKNAIGLMQLLKATANDMGVSNTRNIAQNLRGGISYFRSLLRKYREAGFPQNKLSERQVKIALAAYNSGPGTVNKYGGIPQYPETQQYVRSVMRTYKRLCS